MTTHHIDDDGRHVEELDARLRCLRDELVSHGRTDDVDELLRVVHGNGWTTLIDVAFMNHLLDATQRSNDNTRALRQAMLTGARSIGEAADGPQKAHAGNGASDGVRL